jgi:hypothetical protein
MDLLASWAISPGINDSNADNKADSSDADDLCNKIHAEIITIYRKNSDD